MKKRNFTLAELILVAVLLVTGVVFLVPAAAENARQSFDVACQANLKAMGDAAFGFAEDHDDKLPTGKFEPNQRWFADPGLRANPNNFLSHLLDYTTGDRFVCPAAPENTEEIYRPKVAEERCSFETNGVLVNHLGMGGIPTTQIRNPAETLFLFDRGFTQVGLSITAKSLDGKRHGFGRTHWKPEEIVHGYRHNAVFADGHAGEMRPYYGGVTGTVTRDRSYGLLSDGTPMF